MTEHNIGAMTRRILAWHDRATLEQIEDGTTWYCSARYFAGELAERTPYTLEQVAGVIAVLSPQVNWGQNQKATIAAVEQHLRGETGDELVGYPGYKANVRKAWRVLDGDVGAVAGPKVTAFFAAIVGDLSHVVVDVWATRVARAERDNLARVFRDDEMPSVTERRAMTEAYKRAAALRGVSPAEMQAITWVTCRASGKWAKPQTQSTEVTRRFYRRQIRARLALGLTILTSDNYWRNAPAGRQEAERALAGVA